jgi:hypothetical protein
MKHQTQRWLNRLLFCSCVFVPTLLIGGTMLLRHSEAGQQLLVSWWTDSLEIATDSKVEIGRVYFISPGCYVLEDVLLNDRETGRNILQCDHLRIIRAQDQWELNLHFAQTQYHDIHNWLQWWNGHVLSISEGGKTTVKIQSLTFAKATEQPIVNFVAQITPGNQFSNALLNFGNDLNKPIAIEMKRFHEFPVKTKILLETNGHPVSTKLLGELLLKEFSFGEAATFVGMLALDTVVDAQLMQFNLQGTLHDVELQSLVGGLNESPLRGLATVEISRAIFQNDHWLQLQGNLQGLNGHVSRDWLPTATRQLKLRWLGDLQQPQIPFQAMYCAFSWNQSSLSLRGEPEGEQAGAMLRHANGVILAENPQVLQASLLREVLVR